jgi:uncharacterized membrane protein
MPGNESADSDAPSPPAESQTPLARTWQVVLILLVATGVRFWNLNRWSLWYDEVVSMRVARASGPAEMLSILSAIDGTRAPLHPLLLMGWLRLFGHSDFAARSFSAAVGVATVAAVYAIGRSAFDERTSRWAALLTAVCPTLVYYSQEVRMYALLVFLTVLSWLLFLSLRSRAGWGLLASYAALLAALVYTHPLGLFMVAAHCMAYLVLGRWTVLSIGRWAITCSLVCLAVCPWIGRYLDHGTDYPMPRYSLRFLAAIPIEYIGGNSLTLLAWAPLIVAGLCAWKRGGARLRRPFQGGTLLVWFLVPPLLMYIYSWFVQPIFGPSRYHLYVAPAYLLMVATGLAVLPGPFRLLIGATMLGLAGHALSGMTDAPARKADWRSLAAWLNQRGENALVLVHSHDARFHREPLETARYYLEPETEVQPETRALAVDLDRSQSPHRVAYHAHCSVEPSWKPAPGEVVSARFYGLTIIRDSGSERGSRSPPQGDAP